MSNESSQTLKDVQIVMKEREEMVRVGQEILSMLGRYPYDSPRPDEVAIQKKLLEFMKHLSNIGGFCDSHWNRALFDIQSLLGLIAKKKPVIDFKLLEEKRDNVM